TSVAWAAHEPPPTSTAVAAADRADRLPGGERPGRLVVPEAPGAIGALERARSRGDDRYPLPFSPAPAHPRRDRLAHHRRTRVERRAAPGFAQGPFRRGGLGRAARPDPLAAAARHRGAGRSCAAGRTGA